jgi:hypothetical protein
MKGDFSRYTFNKKKHYNGVLMQQGRVQLDADWNEQQAIDRYRTEIQGKDVVGPCGAPRDNPGFKITWSGGNQLNIGKGHYYVDGILAENENPVDYDKQPDFPTPPDIQKLIKKNGDVGLVYLDVWQRHITSLDNPYLREKALDGPDTTTRLKTVWQVKVLPLSAITISNPKALEENILIWRELEAKLKGTIDENAIKENRSKQIEVEHKIIDLVPMLHCGGEITEWSKEIAPSTGKLNAHTTESNEDEGPCLLPPLAGYKRLENQLYRVEIHKGGPRNVATFKWSRDNASIVTEIIKINGAEVEVSDVGKDEELEFADNQWVEITDDKTELGGQPGQLIQIKNVDSATKIIKLKKSPTPVDMALHPKLRRWDHVKQSGASVAENGIGMGTVDAWIPLEEGIEVHFSAGTYKTGDYWLIPGRTATGEIEWPPYEVPNKNPIAQPPLGIKHHFCRLALVFKYSSKFYVFEDCRRLFPPVTELTNLFYISGDGQEAMPGDDLPKPLVVGVSNGQWPVAGARIRFEIIEGSGQLKDVGTGGCVMTGADGTARCNWRLGNAKRSQQVKTTLLGAGGKTLHIPIIFTANLSRAEYVFYDPKGCKKLENDKNLQLALERLSNLAKISYLSGDGQESLPGQAKGLPKLLQVSVANKCGPVNGAIVRFKAQDNGRVAKSRDELPGSNINTIDVKTKDGIASCAWKLNDQGKPSQQLEATLIPPAGGDFNNIQLPNNIVFTANLSIARQVAYDPKNCAKLAGKNTVQEAIDELCKTAGGGGCAVSVGEWEKDADFLNLSEALDYLLGKQTDICICLLPGDHDLPDGLKIEGPEGSKNIYLKITGCGPGTRVNIKNPWQVSSLGSFVLRDVEVTFDNIGIMQFAQCHEVSLESCSITGITKDQQVLLSIEGADRIRLEKNIINAYQQKSLEKPSIVLEGAGLEAGELFKVLSERDFNLKASRFAKEVSILSLQKRRAIAKEIKRSLNRPGVKLSIAEKNIYNGLADILVAPRRDNTRRLNIMESSLLANFKRIRAVAQRTLPGNAIVIMDEDADVILGSNDINGMVTFYGIRGPEIETLGDQELKSVKEYISRGRLKITGSTGRLQARNNRFTRLLVGDNLIRKIKDIIGQSGSAELSNIFGECFMTDNLIKTGPNQLITKHLSMMSNLFEFGEGVATGEDIIVAGITITDRAVFVGNQAEDNVRIYSVSRDLQGAANLPVNLVIPM